MRVGDKVVFTSACWVGPSCERTRMILTVVDRREGDARSSQAVSVVSGSGRRITLFPADSFEVVVPARPGALATREWP